MYKGFVQMNPIDEYAFSEQPGPIAKRENVGPAHPASGSIVTFTYF